MPRIGRIIASPDVPNPSRPVLVPAGLAGSPFESAEKAFETISKTAQSVNENMAKLEVKRQAIERTNKVLELSSSAKLRAADLEVQLKSNPDPERHYDLFWKGMQSITQQHLEAIGNDPETRTAFMQSWLPHMEQKLAAGMFDQFKMKVGRDKGDLLQSLDAQVKEGVDKPVDQIEGYATSLEKQIENSRPLFTDPEDVAKWKLEWRKKMYQEHAAHGMRQNPIKFLDLYDRGGGPYKGKVDQSALDKIAEQAIAQVKRLDTARDKETKKNSDKVRKFIESKAYDERIDIAPLIRQYEDALDATDLTHLRVVNESLNDKRERKMTESRPGKRVELLAKIELGEITNVRSFLRVAEGTLSEEHTVEGLKMLRVERKEAESEVDKAFKEQYDDAKEYLKTVFKPQATMLDPDALGTQILSEAILTFAQGRAHMKQKGIDPSVAVREFSTLFAQTAYTRGLYGTNEFASVFSREPNLQNLVKNDQYDEARRFVLEKFQKSGATPGDADYGTKEMYLRAINRQQSWRQMNPAKPAAPPKAGKSWWDWLTPRIPGEND